MELKATRRIGLMAVVVDEAQEISETLRVDTLKLMSLVINYGTKQMILAFAWGGYDSQGRFHMDPNRPASHRAINAQVDGEREIWDACACDNRGNPRDADEYADIVRRVLFEHGKIRDVINGGWRLDELELQYQGQVIGRKQRGQSMFNIVLSPG